MLWFLSMILPVVAYNYIFLKYSMIPIIPLVQPESLSMPAVITIVSFFLGNLFLEVGWRRFFEVPAQIIYKAILFLMALVFAVTSKHLNVSPLLIFGFFNCLVLFLLLIFLIRMKLQNHKYASISLVFLIFLGLGATALPIFTGNMMEADSISQSLRVDLSFSLIWRNTFVLFSIYVAVMHKFIVDLMDEMVEKERLMKELERLSLTDALTNLQNRRGFNQFMEYEFKQIQRSGESFAVTLCDIDFFKKVNDRYGHDCGDLVLKEIAAALRRNVRDQDCLARWGGEEFILLQKMDLSQAALSADRIRKEIEGLNFDYENEGFSITMSFGIAGMLPRDKDFEESILAADRNLYKAKDAGRNCVVV
jgi:diguanylate cyclase (GGDEF)-like protein